MGLDMYLTKEHYVKNWDHTKPGMRHKVTVKRGGIIRRDIKPERICTVVEDVGYWRKANHIHAWFVDNCQNGVDECQRTWVPDEKLRELLDLCTRVRDDHSLAEELLPSRGGFFFGSTEYDDGYFQDIELTIKILKDLFGDDEKGASTMGVADIYYHSSW